MCDAETCWWWTWQPRDNHTGKSKVVVEERRGDHPHPILIYQKCETLKSTGQSGTSQIHSSKPRRLKQEATIATPGYDCTKTSSERHHASWARRRALGNGKDLGQLVTNNSPARQNANPCHSATRVFHPAPTALLFRRHSLLSWIASSTTVATLDAFETSQLIALAALARPPAKQTDTPYTIATTLPPAAALRGEDVG
jgi:hypothetical protein